MELVHAFCMKLQPDIAKFLISREEPFSNILVAIESAKRHESVISLPVSSSQPEVSMRPEALYTAHPALDNRTKFAAQKPEGIKNEICRNFNRFSPSRCELPDNKCMHICSLGVLPDVSCTTCEPDSFLRLRLSKHIAVVDLKVHYNGSTPPGIQLKRDRGRNCLEVKVLTIHQQAVCSRI